MTKYRAILAEAGLAPNTINRRLAAIKSLVAFGRKLGVCNYAVDVDSIPVQPYLDTSGCTGEEFLTVIKGFGLWTKRTVRVSFWRTKNLGIINYPSYFSN
ncbi:hypothetical protein [Nostoc flagelliforme]|uniref:hypothetical protein n=1 Tax=Nostoc flagelliforme TaxID=1306274 RepID=UPI000C2CE9EC|nr:hypothetical protein [Nostoc flagelliforme]